MLTIFVIASRDQRTIYLKSPNSLRHGLVAQLMNRNHSWGYWILKFGSILHTKSVFSGMLVLLTDLHAGSREIRPNKAAAVQQNISDKIFQRSFQLDWIGIFAAIKIRNKTITNRCQRTKAKLFSPGTTYTLVVPDVMPFKATSESR